MSRSNNTDIKNPCTRWLDWSGDLGVFKYWDKEAKDGAGENIEVPLPFSFLVLDELHTVTGFLEEEGGFWSNEVRNIKADSFTVRAKRGIFAQGIWSQLKAVTGLRYTKSIYIAFKDDEGKLILGNIKARGAFGSAWIEYTKGKDVYKGAFIVKSSEEKKKGRNTYFVPVFAQTQVKDETDEAAKKIDIELQEYLAAYFKRNASASQDNQETPSGEPDNWHEQPEPEGIDDDLGF